jgi:isomerase DpgB
VDLTGRRQLTHTNESPAVLTVVHDDPAELTRSVGAFLARQAEDLAVFDLRRLDPHTAEAGDIGVITRWERALRGIERAAATTAALLGPNVQGPALEIALACDFRIAPPDGRLCWTDEHGIWPSTALHRLVRLLGPRGARRFLLLDQSWDARTALANALVDVLAEDQFEAVAGLRRKLGSVKDMRVVRQLLEEASTVGYDDALGAHLAACDRSLRRREATR